MRKTFYIRPSETQGHYEKRVDSLIERGWIRTSSGKTKIIGYRKNRALDGTLIKADVELEAKGWA